MLRTEFDIEFGKFAGLIGRKFPQEVLDGCFERIMLMPKSKLITALDELILLEEIPRNIIGWIQRRFRGTGTEAASAASAEYFADPNSSDPDRRAITPEQATLHQKIVDVACRLYKGEVYIAGMTQFYETFMATQGLALTTFLAAQLAALEEEPSPTQPLDF